jgi:DNA primase
MISAEAVERVKDALPISQVVSAKVKLRRAGSIWKGLCPFHSEKTPSFTCSDPRATFKCFGCDAGGDAVEFMRLAYGLSFVEAVETLARQAGIDLPKATLEETQREAKRLSIIEVLEEAREWFRAQLTANGDAKTYVKARGIDQRTIEAYSIGYAPAGPDGRGSMLKQALGQRAGIEGLAHAGLIVAGDGVPVSYDRYRSRIVIPVRDHRGRTVSFTGRYLGHGDAPKWLNGPETEVFHKGSVLFNADRARQGAHETGNLAVVEGPMDAIACERAGFPAVAPLGTALTADHVKGLWRLTDTPRAAAKAMATAFPLLVPGRSLKFAWMPSGVDPDDLSRQRGPEALRGVLQASEGLADALWRVHSKNASLGTPDGAAKLEAELMELVGTVPDDQLRRKYRDNMKERIRAATRPKPIIRSNGHSMHSTNPGALKLVYGLPPTGRFTLKEAVFLATLIQKRDIDEAEPNGLSDRTRQIISEIHHLIASVPEEEFIQGLKGDTKGAISEALDILHSAGISQYDVEGLS